MSSERVAAPAAATPGDPYDARPSVSRPDALSAAALADARGNQPRRGLEGLLFVVPVTVLLSVGAGGAPHSLELLGPIITYALPIMAMVAFWWDDWPGSLLPRPWSGPYDTVFVVAGGLLLTMLGQMVVNGADPLGVFAPGAAHPGLYPAGNALGGGIFTIVLQLTLVCERRPLNRMSRVPAGLVAVGLCWTLGLLAWLAAVRSRAVPSESYGAWFTSIGAAQMLFYVALRGWPFARVTRTWLRLLFGNATVIATGWAAYLVAADAAGWPGPRVTSVAGTAIGAILLVTMLFEAWPAIHLAPAPGRTVAVATAALLTAVLSVALPALAAALAVPPVREWSWTTQVTLNALSTAIILHVAVWRRWPIRTRPAPDRG